MFLVGSCHCGEVQFQLNSSHPYPFNYCYCSICRKKAHLVKDSIPDGRIVRYP